MADKEKNEFIGKEVQAVPRPEPQIGADTKNTLVSDLLDASLSNAVDINSLQTFSSVARTRESVYQVIDTMCQDSTIQSILETYTEDVTQPNENGAIVWVDSADTRVSKYVSFLIDSLGIDKHIYDWAYCLIKYGDVYLKLYRESDYNKQDIFTDEQREDAEAKKRLTEQYETWEQITDSLDKLTDDDLDKLEGTEKKKEPLKEDVIINYNKKGDHFVPYVEMVDNPGEMFELTSLGKTHGYIKAPVNIQTTLTGFSQNHYDFLQSYKFVKNDVTVYSALDFAHGKLTDTSSRVSEEVHIFNENNDAFTNSDTTKAISYKVNKGKSILFDTFKIWRELSLLENSVLLNRLTKSSLVRAIQVEVGNMGKEQVQAYLSKIKMLIEQKSALDTNNRMNEYTNPGPVENTIYIPTKEGKGALTISQIGGEVDPKQLTDLSYFQDKFFGSLRVPKQFFGVTDDSAGFSGGESLAIISSRYGKAVKRIQMVLCQLITDVINIFLLDRGFLSYINNFTIRMQAPLTKEELDKRNDTSNRLRNITDIMSTLNEVEDKTAKLKILKILLTTVINDADIMGILQEEIDKLELEEETSTEEKSEETSEEMPERPRHSGGDRPHLTLNEPDIEEIPETPEIEMPEEEPTEELPSPEDLGIDLTSNI